MIQLEEKPKTHVARIDVPKVSVCIVTYNHAAFIAQAVESVLMQRTAHSYEIVIGDDCSTDGTREILQDYQARYPDIIRLFARIPNIGALPNVVATLNACRGEYVALLEGDDYWSSPDKLQKQITFLDEHPEYAQYSHNARIQNDKQPELVEYLCRADLKTELTLEDLLINNPLATCSALFRRKNVDPLPDWFSTLPLGDWSLYVLNAQNGLIAYDPEPMGVYRVHNSNNWTGQRHAKIIESCLTALECYKAHLDTTYAPRIDTSRANLMEDLAWEYAASGDAKQAWKSLRGCLQLRRPSPAARIKLVTKMTLMLRAPRLYRSAHKIKNGREA